MAYADTRKKVIRYLDSLGDGNDLCVEVLLDYLRVSSSPKCYFQQILNILYFVPKLFNIIFIRRKLLKFKNYLKK